MPIFYPVRDTHPLFFEIFLNIYLNYIFRKLSQYIFLEKKKASLS